jgi:hypothetical protein
MFSRLFPKQFDNRYQGYALAILLFALILLLRAAQAVAVLADARETLITADAIPLHTYTAAGAEAVISYATILAFQGLLLPLQGIVVLIRYRAMIPFMYLCLLVLTIGNRVLSSLHPIATADAPSIAAHAEGELYVPNAGEYVGLVILAATVIGFILSLVSPRGQAHAPQRNA